MDLYSKKIDTELTVKAVENTYKVQRPTNTLILHSDLGSMDF